MNAVSRPSKEQVDNARLVLLAVCPDPLSDEAHTSDRVFAANTLMEACENPELVDFPEMLRCLEFGGVIAEFGARCLYVRTGRDGLGWNHGGSNGLPFIVDRANWKTYLEEHGFH
jgi:hypothetical protein